MLNVLFLSWLYAYYCFDYKWALEGVRLPNRLHFFECNWAYFAGRQEDAKSLGRQRSWMVHPPPCNTRSCRLWGM